MIVLIVLAVLSTLASGLIVDVNVYEDIKYTIPYAGFEGGNVQKYFTDVENLGSVACKANIRADFPSLSMEGIGTLIKPGGAARLFAYTRLDNGTHEFNITVSFCNSTTSKGPYFVDATKITTGNAIDIIDYISDHGKLRLRIRSREDDIVIISTDGGKIRSMGAKLNARTGTIYMDRPVTGKSALSIVSASGSDEFSGEIETGESPLYKKIIFSIREMLGI